MSGRAENVGRMFDKKIFIGRLIKVGKWFLFISGICLIVLSLIYDLVHHGILPKGKLMELAEGFLKGLGFNYCQAGSILRDGFATLFTAMSLVFTIGMSLMNRSEDQIYGVSRMALAFNGKELLYKCVSCVVYGVPVFMALAVNLGYTAFGYSILFAVYGYLLYCYGIFRGTFDGKANEERMVLYLSRKFPRNLSNREDLSAYRKLLAGIDAGVRNDNDWQGVKELIYGLLKRDKDLNKGQRFVQVYTAYNDIFPTKASAVLLEVLIDGQRILENRRMQEGESNVEKYYLSVWAMFCGAFPGLTDAEIVHFLEGLLDFKGRFAEIERKYDREYGDSQHEIMKVEVGMALVLLECRLNGADSVSDELQKLFPTVWNQGKYLFADSNRNLLEEAGKYYKNWVDLPDGQWEIYMGNLRRDYEENSKYSIIRNLDE